MPRRSKEWFNSYEAKRRAMNQTAVINVVGVAQEETLHDQITKACMEQQWPFLHGSMAHVTHRTKGEFDFVIGASNGVTLYVECKKHGKKLSDDQRDLHFDFQRQGHKTLVCYNMDQFWNFAREVGAI